MTLKNVVALPASATMSAEQALLSALEFTRENNLTDVLIAGYDADGVLIVRSSRMTRAEALFMLEKTKEWAMTP